MKKILLLATISVIAFANCDYKIQKLQRELTYAKHYNNSNKATNLENAIENIKQKCYGDKANETNTTNYKQNLEKETKTNIDDIKQQLKTLEKNKNNMSKSEYKSKKKELKQQIKNIKKEYKQQKNNFN